MLGFIKLKKTIKRIKGQTDWEEIFAEHLIKDLYIQRTLKSQQ